MTLDYLGKRDFPGGDNVPTSNDDGDVGLRGFLNKLIELSKTWTKVLASAFTTAADAGAFEDMTGMAQIVTPTNDTFVINARADLEFESAGTAAAILKARIIIGADTGETFTMDVATAITESKGFGVSHSFTGVKGTAYTVKLQVADDGTTAQTISIATMTVSLGSVQA